MDELNLHHTFEDVRNVFIHYIKNEDDRNNIKKAYDFVVEKHKTQFRKSGEPYVQHLIETAYTVAKLQGGPSTIIAGFLHDVVEDTDVTTEEVEALFGSDVSHLVEAVTKIQRMQLNRIDEEEFEAEGHRKIFIAMAKDIRVIIVKLADRLHNMRTLEWLKPNRQIAISRETLEVYAPVAHRLGLNKIKSELEDLSLKYLEPEKYNHVLNLLNENTKNRSESLVRLKKKLADLLYEHNIPFIQIESRVKSIYSIYKKMFIKGRDFNEIYDIMALRVITKTELNCYEILGLVHSVYKPLPGRFKDYIAMPKPNLYQSLHTTIISGDGQFFEIQIRTEEMDEIAEEGIAAHWRYKEGSKYSPEKEQKEIEEKLHWFRDFVSMSSDELSTDAKEYMATLNKDVFDANIYIFTPKGRVIDLPSGSTPLDFAYKIHTGVGDSAVGAIVNGSLVPLGTELKTGDVVEIKTSKSSAGPNEGWLKLVKTNAARNHIRKQLTKKNMEFVRDEKISQGKIALIDAFKERGYNEQEMIEKVNNPKVLNNFQVDSFESLCVNVSNRNPLPSSIMDFLNLKKKVDPNAPLKLTDAKKAIGKNLNPVIVKNAGNVAINLGPCCTPIPGDDIVGYITRGKGITVHRCNCPNIAKEKNRLIDVYWNEELEAQQYQVDIQINGSDRSTLLIDIMGVLAQMKCNCSAISSKVHSSSGTSTIQATLLVHNASKVED
ncbi:MAG: bifunctional (p)ppGpp synthetase/guanosine-3',5'-bis(diphosphate) 3'-pyrophosphohydrolase, partial [Bacilli bacterium]|nr:bifunctional (p)ppGpp synthetase/guanosine-3',5'-bis(diphosphate) 3'-pyrophosphohydrolase [Bacilli bacterium]